MRRLSLSGTARRRRSGTLNGYGTRCVQSPVCTQRDRYSRSKGSGPVWSTQGKIAMNKYVTYASHTSGRIHYA